LTEYRELPRSKCSNHPNIVPTNEIEPDSAEKQEPDNQIMIYWKTFSQAWLLRELSKQYGDTRDH
jgi:hypothetical protein